MLSTMQPYLEIQKYLDISDYVPDASNSIITRSSYCYRWYLKSTSTSHCSLCGVTPDVYCWGEGNTAAICCPRCVDRQDPSIEYPNIEVECDRVGFTMQMRIVLTPRQMILNIRSTHPGIFCYSCRATRASMRYAGIINTCDLCFEYLMRCIIVRQLVAVICLQFGVPQDVATVVRALLFALHHTVKN